MNINGTFISDYIVVTTNAPKQKQRDFMKNSENLENPVSFFRRKGGGGDVCRVHEFKLFLVCILFCPPDSSTSATRSKAQPQSFVPW